MTKSNFEI